MNKLKFDLFRGSRRLPMTSLIFKTILASLVFGSSVSLATPLGGCWESLNKTIQIKISQSPMEADSIYEFIQGADGEYHFVNQKGESIPMDVDGPLKVNQDGFEHGREGKSARVEAIYGVEDTKRLAELYQVKVTEIPIYDPRFYRPLSVHFGLRFGETYRRKAPLILKSFLNELHEIEEMDERPHLEISHRRSHHLRATLGSHYFHSQMVKILPPVLNFSHSNPVLSLEVVRQHRNRYRESVVSLVLNHNFGILKDHFIYNFQGSSLGTGEGEAYGRILLSPQIIPADDQWPSALTKNENVPYPRQVLILNSRLELIDYIPVDAKNPFTEIFFLSMDEDYYFIVGRLQDDQHQLQVFRRKDLRRVLVLSRATEEVPWLPSMAPFPLILDEQSKVQDHVLRGWWSDEKGLNHSFRLNLEPLLKAKH